MRIIIDEDVNNNNCDELIKLIDAININDDKNMIQQNIKLENFIEEDNSQNLNESISNIIDSNLMVPLRERVKNKILYPKPRKRKNSSPSGDKDGDKKRKNSVSKIKKK